MVVRPGGVTRGQRTVPGRVYLELEVYVSVEVTKEQWIDQCRGVPTIEHGDGVPKR